MKRSIHLCSLAACAALLAACDLDVPDLDDPGLDELEDHPTRASITAACVGLQIGSRAPHTAATPYVAQLGVLGREAYVFDQADPRVLSELLEGALDPGSPFGGGFWTEPYANVRLANIVERVVDDVADLTAEERAAIRGFAGTLEALDLLTVIATRDTNGAVIDTDRALDDGPGAIAPRADVLAEIARLLDEAAGELDAAGAAFPFALSSGYAGFDTPLTFRRFNRALRARVALYADDPQGALDALGQSFLDASPAGLAALDVGVYHAFSTASGDVTNGLVSPTIYVHPSIAAGAQLQPGGAPDARLQRKVALAATPGSGRGLSSDRVFTIYGGPEAPVPVIRNEELILLRAEARLRLGDDAGAKADLDVVRTVSGGLDPLPDPPAPTSAELLDELIYNRAYSLLFEGHRWIDLRRAGRLDQLPLDLLDHQRNARYPIPLAECNARPPDEPACAGGSL